MPVLGVAGISEDDYELAHSVYSLVVPALAGCSCPVLCRARCRLVLQALLVDIWPVVRLAATWPQYFSGGSMLSRAIPECTNDDVQTYGQKIGETYQRLDALRGLGVELTNDQVYIMALTRLFGHMQKELKECLGMLEQRKGFRG